MQLKKIKSRMGLATCALLQIAAPVVHAAETEWDFDTAFMIYSEGDGRVQALEPGIFAGRELEGDARIDLKLIVDAITGASPNGAHASSVAQTFTTPSGGKTYTVAAGETPQDETFRDTRVALSADWSKPIDRLTTMILGMNFSTEFDYVSTGFSANLTRDFNNRNTTLSAGIGVNNDTIEAAFGTPTKFNPMRGLGPGIRSGTSESKTTTDFLLGITQVISRNTLMQLNYSFGKADGYQNDPYKLLTVVDSVTGLPTTSGLINVDVNARPYVYENRPDTRNKSSLFYRVVHHLTDDVIHFSYRYYWDDWEITSHTFDFRYRYGLDKESYLQPHFRLYSQEAAEFYRHNLVQGSDVDANGNVLLNFASNDYRLATFDATTIGMKYGLSTGDDSEFSARAELITQMVDGAGVPALEQTPDLDSIVVQIGYNFKW